MSLFQGLKEKFNEKFSALKASTAPQDPLEKQAYDLVDKATSDGLIEPEWALNLAVVDFLNSDVRQHGARVSKGIRRSLSKQNTKVQLLSLTLLETCVKNSTEDFHFQLATSELWDDIVKLAGDTSITRVDAEVRDKMLAMVEDYARALKFPQYQQAYESLLDKGVDFPVRGADDAAPILMPQGHPAAGPEAAGPAPVPAAAAGGGNVDPFAGMSEQDRAAIQALLAADQAAEAAAQEAERIAREADAEEQRQERLRLEQEQQQQQAELLAAQEEQRRQQAEAEAAAAASLIMAAETAAAATVPAGEPHPSAAAAGGEPGAEQQEQQEQAGTPEERTARILERANESTLLLSEMLASVPDSEPVAVREPLVAEVADTCMRLRRKLERELETLADETLMASALGQHEEISRVLSRYDELLAAAEVVAPTMPRNAAAVARAHAGAGQPQPQAYGPGHAPAAAGPQGAGTAAEPVGQKVAQTAAVFAAAVKEKVTGAFDKFMAAASRGPAPPGTTTGAPGAATAGGYYAPPSYAAVGVPGADPGVAGVRGSDAPAPGNFTLDDEEEPNEGTSLITRRAPAQDQAPQWAAPQQQQQPAHDHLSNLMSQATSAPAPPAPAPVAAPQPAAAAAGPDLIDFGDEPEHPPAPAAAPAPADVAVPPPAGDMLSGLNVHAPTEATAAAPTEQPPAAPMSAPPPAAEPAPFSTPGAAPTVSHSRGPSQADQLVEALDRLVSQASVGTSPPGSVGVKGEGLSASGSAEAGSQQQQQ